MNPLKTSPKSRHFVVNSTRKIPRSQYTSRIDIDIILTYRGKVDYRFPRPSSGSPVGRVPVAVKKKLAIPGTVASVTSLASVTSTSNRPLPQATEMR